MTFIKKRTKVVWGEKVPEVNFSGKTIQQSGRTTTIPTPAGQLSKSYIWSQKGKIVLHIFLGIVLDGMEIFCDPSQNIEKKYFEDNIYTAKPWWFLAIFLFSHFAGKSGLRCKDHDLFNKPRTQIIFRHQNTEFGISDNI